MQLLRLCLCTMPHNVKLIMLADEIFKVIQCPYHLDIPYEELFVSKGFR
jgi:hypothetical protein